MSLLEEIRIVLIVECVLFALLAYLYILIFVTAHKTKKKIELLIEKIEDKEKTQSKDCEKTKENIDSKL